MSSRPPPDQSDMRHGSRDWSPPRFVDRRSSTSYTGQHQSPRITDPNYRSFESNAYQSAGRDPPRDPPRGPKALVDGSRGGYVSRGRGFSGRGDFRDREFRDSRDGSVVRGRDRDWNYRGPVDSRDRRPSPPGRGRTRSPPQREYSRDSGDFISRDPDRDRQRRDSVADAPPLSGFRGRGSYRGRGRGDWDYGPRGRGSHGDDRDGYHARSRSRDRNWDRPIRDERDRDQEYVRRDRRSWDDRERDADKFRRDPPIRPDSRNSTGTNPSTPRSATGPASNQLNVDRGGQTYRGPSSDTSRRSSGPSAGSTLPGVARESPRTESFMSRPDRDRIGANPPSSPPQAPQVPAFGSVSYKAPQADHSIAASRRTVKEDVPITLAPRPAQDTARQPPSAPKAQLLSSAPTAPKAELPVERFPITDPTRQGSENFSPRLSGSLPGPQISARPTSLQLVHPIRKEAVDEKNRQDTVISFPSRHAQRDALPQGQVSPAKIPTGPRAERSVPSIRQIAPPTARAPPTRPQSLQWGRGQANLTWVRPGLSQGLPQHTPRGPSIMKKVPTKRDSAGDEKIRSPIPDTDYRESESISWPRDDPSLKADLDEAKAEGQELEAPLRRPTTGRNESSSQKDLKSDLADFAQHVNQASSLPEVPHKVESQDTTEAMDLDENDYEVAERKFNRELQLLESKRPPTPRRDPEILLLLEECDALASALEDLANGIVQPLPEPAGVQSPAFALGLPSPKMEESEKLQIDIETSFEPLPIRFRKQTPPVESLPFLASGPPTPFSEIGDLQQGSDFFETVKSRIEDKEAIQRGQVALEHGKAKEIFAKLYRPWRMKNLELEDQEKASADATPTPAPTEVPSALISGPTSISGRRVRSTINTTNVDMEAVLEQSRKTFEDEEEKRNNQLAETGPNFDKEAIIPDMLSIYESVNFAFNDQNNLVASELTLETLDFFPPQDDFSAEEHNKFVEQYILCPKKWGTIAQVIPGRDYQDCVQHYYLTKGRYLYKEKEKAFLRIRKGRKGPRGPQGRAKSSNLIPLYDGNNEPDPATAVTETGRPKRTAAPIFGSTGDVEPSTSATTPIRRNLTNTKSDASGEPASEKPKRTRGAGPKEKGTKRGKPTLLPAASGPSPQKGEKEGPRARSREPKNEIDPQIEELEGAHVLAGLQSSHNVVTAGNQPVLGESWISRPSVSINTQVQAHKPQQPSFEPQLQIPHQSGGQPVTSSYWSVPEHKDFKNLLGYHGTNWQAIADSMKTKTVTMVRNYYNRAAEKDNGEHLKEIATKADERIERGEDLGPPPAPTTVTKRKYDTNPQMIPQRALAPSAEHVEHDGESPRMLNSKPAQASPPQFHNPPSRYPVLAQAESSPTPAFSQAANQGIPSTSSRAQTQPQLQQQRSGPRSGFFPDERSRPILQAQPSTTHQMKTTQEALEQQALRARQKQLQIEAQTSKEATTQRAQEFREKLEQQHQSKFPEPHQTGAQQQPHMRSQSQTTPQSHFTTSQSVTPSQVRIAPSQQQQVDTEPKQRVISQPSQQQFDVAPQDLPMAVRRLEPSAQNRYLQSSAQSPVTTRLPLAMSKPDENTRPSSVPAPTPTQQPPRTAPPLAKRSNIMSILNDEPAEPQPRKRLSDSRTAAPTPPPQSPATLTPSYHQPPQPSYHREHSMDSNSHVLQHQHRYSLSQSANQQQQQQQQQQAQNQPQDWATAAQRLNPEKRPNYHPVINSPRNQPLYLQQQSSRTAVQPLQRTHAPSPPPAQFAHSRTPSYASGLSQQHQQQAPSQHSQQQAPPSQSTAAPNLQPSPYASIRPDQHQHHQVQHQRTQHEQAQRHMEEQRHYRQLDLKQREAEQQRQRQEELLQQQQQQQREAAQRQYKQHQQAQQLQQQQHQRVEQQRRQSDQHQFLRPKEPLYPSQPDQNQLLHYQHDLMRHEQEQGRQEQARREQVRVFTPPVYTGQGYGAPAPPQPGPVHLRYEERRG